MSRGRCAATLIGALVLLMPADASAAPGDRMSAAGTILPGLTTTCTDQTVSFFGSATPLGGGQESFEFDGSSVGCATLWAESGSGTFSGDITGNATYERTGALMVINRQTSTYVCGWLMTTILPTTTFKLDCVDTVSLR